MCTSWSTWADVGCSSLNDLMTLPVDEGSDEENDEDDAEDPEAEEGE